MLVFVLLPVPSVQSLAHKSANLIVSHTPWTPPSSGQSPNSLGTYQPHLSLFPAPGALEPWSLHAFSLGFFLTFLNLAHSMSAFLSEAFSDSLIPLLSVYSRCASYLCCQSTCHAVLKLLFVRDTFSNLSNVPAPCKENIFLWTHLPPTCSLESFSFLQRFIVCTNIKVGEYALLLLFYTTGK